MAAIPFAGHRVFQRDIMQIKVFYSADAGARWAEVALLGPWRP